MKKKDGYVIIYVVFVIIFLCIVAVSTCTVALSNLKTQTSYIEQMQKRYEAEGAIEKFMAEVCVFDSALAANGYESSEAAALAAKSAFASNVTNKDNNNDNVTCVDSGVWVDGSNEYKITLASSCGSTTVSADVLFNVNIKISSYMQSTGILDEYKNEILVQRFGYQVSSATSEYLSYTLESTGGGSE